MMILILIRGFRNHGRWIGAPRMNFPARQMRWRLVAHELQARGAPRRGAGSQPLVSTLLSVATPPPEGQPVREALVAAASLLAEREWSECSSGQHHASPR
jgi:hypothetical protein